MTNVMSQKQFNNTLNGAMNSARNMRDKVQTLAMDALYHFQASNDCTRMSTLIHRVKSVKAVNTSALKQYFEAHANVTFCKLKDETDGFRKSGKGDAEITVPDVEWYNFRNQTTQPQALVIDQKVTSILKAMKKADENEQEIQVKDKENLKAQLDELYKYTV